MSITLKQMFSETNFNGHSSIEKLKAMTILV